MVQRRASTLASSAPERARTFLEKWDGEDRARSRTLPGSESFRWFASSSWPRSCSYPARVSPGRRRGRRCGLRLTPSLVGVAHGKTWLSWVTCATDVTLISATLISFVIMGEPLFAIHNRVSSSSTSSPSHRRRPSLRLAVCLFTLGLAISGTGDGPLLHPSLRLATFVGHAQPDVYEPVNALRVHALFARGDDVTSPHGPCLRLLISRDR